MKLSPHISKCLSAWPNVVFRSRDLDKIGIPRSYATSLVLTGEIISVGRGLYIKANHPLSENLDLALMAKATPNAIICLVSALRFHAITTQLPSHCWIALPPKARLPTAPNAPIQVVRFSGDALVDGVSEHVIDGVPVKITDPARTIVDCFCYRNRVGIDIAVEALRDGVGSGKATLGEIAHFAHTRRMTNIMRPYIEMLQ